MKTNRRRFLSLLGLSAASAPLAAKAAADSEMAALSGLKNASLAVGVSASSGYGIPDVSQTNVISPYIQAAGYLKSFGKLPIFVENNLRERAKYVEHLDPDIVCKRSWSLNVKIAAQRERNYQREVERIQRSATYDLGQSTFKKITGFEWPW